MKTSDILIALKRSKYEWDMHRLRLAPRELKAKYLKQGADFDQIYQSHLRQVKGRHEIRRIFKGARFASREQLDPHEVKSAKLVITFGGDNHFQFVTHFILKTLMVGINSDPSRSEGALTSIRSNQMERLANSIFQDDYEVETWPRIEITLSGKKLSGLAVSEVFLGEIKRANMSRHRIRIGKKSEEQKSSGILITTGAGSSGWYDSACRYLYPKGDRFKRTAPYIKFLVTEPYFGKLSSARLLSGTVRKGQTLIIHSLNDSDGMLSVDAEGTHRFPEGYTAKIRLGEPLRVLKV